MACASAPLPPEPPAVNPPWPATALALTCTLPPVLTVPVDVPAAVAVAVLPLPPLPPPPLTWLPFPPGAPALTLTAPTLETIACAFAVPPRPKLAVSPLTLVEVPPVPPVALEMAVTPLGVPVPEKVRFMFAVAFPAAPVDVPLTVPPLPPAEACCVSESGPVVLPETVSEEVPVVELTDASAPLPPLAPRLPYPPFPPVTSALTCTVPPPVELPMELAVEELSLPPWYPTPWPGPPLAPVTLLSATTV